VQQARSAGVVEDISATAGSSANVSGSSFGGSSGFGAGGAEFVSGGGGGSGAGCGGSAFDSSSFSSGGAGAADSAFAQTDTNHDGSLDQNEFRSFYSQQLGGAGGESSFESRSS
ncbi:unnamed protein product, partial [Rotaria magnacalcarata]